MAKINVLMRKEDIAPLFLHDKVVVVIDTLFATSTIVTALHQGASEVLPMASSEKACEVVRTLAKGSYVLAGESQLQQISGFSSYSPLALSQENLAGKSLVYTTTNGAVALNLVTSARVVYAAALLNGPAVVQQLLRHKNTSIILACSGSAGRINLEDVFTAGYLVDQLCAMAPNSWELTDTCEIAQAVYHQHAGQPESCLCNSQLGKTLSRIGMDHEVCYAAKIGLLDIVPTMQGSRMISLDNRPLLPNSGVTPGGY